MLIIDKIRALLPGQTIAPLADEKRAHKGANPTDGTPAGTTDVNEVSEH